MLAAGAHAQNSLCGDNPTRELSFRLSSPPGEVKSGEKAFVTLTETNVSKSAVKIWVENTSDPGGIIFPIEVRDENGKLRPEGHFSLALRGLKNPKYLTPETPINGSGGCVPLRPGESRSYRIELTRLYDMRTPGTYTATLVDNRAGHPVKGLSNSVSVKVTP